MKPTDFHYELFFELSPDLLCIAGYDGYFKKINRAVSELLGYTKEELHARPINDFVFEDDKAITNHVRSELTRAKPLLNFENRYVTKSGEIVWLSWTSFPVESDQLIFAIAKNITHKKRLEDDRNSLLANLTKVNNDLKKLSYTTSHDLRSPVDNLLGLFKLIDTTSIGDRETAEFMEVLQLAGEKLRQTLNNYIDLLNEKDRADTIADEVVLPEVLDDVLQSIHWLIQSSKTTIHTDFSRLDKVKFNKDYLRSVFLNLITNAIKYAKPGCPAVISIYAEKTNDVKRLVVSDNGQGFDMEKVKDEIFGLNQRFHDYNDSKGIGLYLVHSHVTSAGGKINVESKPGEGTTFNITFKK